MGSSCAKYTKQNTKMHNIYTSEELINWSTSQELYKYHWWPMIESKNPYYNNLY